MVKILKYIFVQTLWLKIGQLKLKLGQNFEAGFEVRSKILKLKFGQDFEADV